MFGISFGFYRGRVFVLAMVAVSTLTIYSVFNRDISADSVPFETIGFGQSRVMIDLAKNGSSTINGKHVASIVEERPSGQRVTYIATDAQGQFIDHLLVVINLPTAITQDQVLLNAIGAYGVGASTYQLVSPTQIQYEVTGLGPQAIYTIEADLPDGYFNLPFTQQIGPTLEALPVGFWLTIGLVFPVLALLILGVLVQRSTAEWRHTIGKAKQRETPPNNLAPALAGVILGGKMNARMLAATLIDLAERNYLIISNHGNSFTFGKRRGVSDVTTTPGDLAPFEVQLMDKLFLPTALRSTQSDIDVRLGHRLFSRKIASVYLEVYDQLTSAGYFHDNPSAIWQRYRTIGITLFFVALAGFSLTLIFTSAPKYPLISWVGLMIASLIVMRGAPLLPRRTPKGVEALQQWNAFRDWLRSPTTIPNGTDPTTYRRYLAYAIAFGVEVEWTRRFVGNVFQPPGWLVTPVEFLKIDDFAAQLFPIVGYVATGMAAVRDPNS